MIVSRIGSQLASRGHDFTLLLSSADQKSRQQLENSIGIGRNMQILQYTGDPHFKAFQQATDASLKASRDPTKVQFCRGSSVDPAWCSEQAAVRRILPSAQVPPGRADRLVIIVPLICSACAAEHCGLCNSVQTQCVRSAE